MPEIKVAFKAIIKKDDKILVIKRSSNEEVYSELWDIPGGRMNFGETPAEALKREAKEETGLDIELNRPFRIWTFMANPEKQVIGITCIADYVSGEVILSAEHTEFRWIDASEFQALAADKHLKEEISLYAKSRQ